MKKPKPVDTFLVVWQIPFTYLDQQVLNFSERQENTEENREKYLECFHRRALYDEKLHVYLETSTVFIGTCHGVQNDFADSFPTVMMNKVEGNFLCIYNLRWGCRWIYNVWTIVMRLLTAVYRNDLIDFQMSVKTAVVLFSKHAFNPIN